MLKHIVVFGITPAISPVDFVLWEDGAVIIHSLYKAIAIWHSVPQLREKKGTVAFIQASPFFKKIQLTVTEDIPIEYTNQGQKKQKNIQSAPNSASNLPQVNKTVLVVATNFLFPSRYSWKGMYLPVVLAKLLSFDCAGTTRRLQETR